MIALIFSAMIAAAFLGWSMAKAYLLVTDPPERRAPRRPGTTRHRADWRVYRSRRALAAVGLSFLWGGDVDGAR